MVKIGIFSGKEICKILGKEGFENIRQKGSHVVMQKRVHGETITVPVPMHNEIKMGTNPEDDWRYGH